MVRPAGPEVREALLSAIGLATATWSLFEVTVNSTIWKLAETAPEVGACMTSHINAPAARLRALIALVDLRGGTSGQIKALGKLSERADGLARQRNRIIHDSWLTTMTGGHLRLEITADRQLVFEHKGESVDAIKVLVEKMEKLRADLDQQMQEIFAALPPMPKFPGYPMPRSVRNP